METKGTTGEKAISYWFDLPIDVAEFEEKLGIGAESGDYRIIEKVLPYADEVHEHTSVYQLNELDFMYRQLSSDMQEEYVSLLAYYVSGNVIEPIGRDYLYSELVNPIFTKDGDNVKVKVAVKFIDNQTKATQVSQYELVLQKDSNWKIVE